MKTVSILVGVILGLLLGVCHGAGRNDDTYPLPVLVRHVVASSMLLEKNVSSFAYHPVNLYDDDITTGWFEGVRGDGVGEFVEMEFFMPVGLPSVTLVNGYGKSEDLFYKNGSVRQLEVIAGDQRKVLSLEETRESQRFVLDFRNVKKIRFVIMSVYQGEQYADTGISEISLHGIPEGELPLRVSPEEIAELYEGYRDGAIYNTDKNAAFSKFTREQLEAFLANEFVDQGGALNLDRLGFITSNVARNQALIPTFLKAALTSNPGVFRPYADGDPYANVALDVWGEDYAGVPFLRRHMYENFSSYYHLLALGDTRAVPEYLRLMAESSGWESSCCPLMPGELLAARGDTYTLKVLRRFMAGGALEDHPMREAGIEELSKAEDALLDKFYP